MPSPPTTFVPCAGFNPPPVSETKAAFLQKYPRPLPGIYDTVIQELLVQQHLLRYQKKYEYDKVLQWRRPVSGCSVRIMFKAFKKATAMQPIACWESKQSSHSRDISSARPNVSVPSTAALAAVAVRMLLRKLPKQ